MNRKSIAKTGQQLLEPTSAEKRAYFEK